MALSLPGLGLEEPEEIQAVETSEHTLSKESEWRFEVAVGKYITARLLTGTAELFGTELVINTPYVLTGTKAAIYTWHGCTFEVTGDAPQSEYIAEETPMSDYTNVHFALEQLRENARAYGRQGPRVLILGPENAGKSTLAKILTGYAVRSAKAPVIVSLDGHEGVMSLPGTMTATVFKSLMDVEEGWGSAPMSGPSGTVPVKLPLVYYYGMANPDDRDGVVYKALVNRIALAATGRMQQDPEAREAGAIIDTPGSLVSTKSAGIGYDIIQHIVSEFGVSFIVCLGSERLYSDMVKRFDNTTIASNSSSATQETISVIKLAKSGGCVDRDEAFMRAYRGSQIRNYFYGNARLSNGVTLSPRQQQVDFNHLTVYRLIGGSSTGSSSYNSFAAPGDDNEFLPGGHDGEDFYGSSSHASSKVPLPASQLFERVTAPHPAMRNCVLAVLNCDSEADQDEIRDSSVMGFLYVTDVDEARARIGLLAPVAGRVPERAIVWGGWPEPVVGMTGL